MITVAKFGGSSVADENQFKKVKNIVLGDEKRKIVVVSALGKRNKTDNKITDLLYLLAAHIRYGVDSTHIMNTIIGRYEEITKALNVSVDVKREFGAIAFNMKNGFSEDYLVSRGEYLCAKIMAEYLGYKFVDAADVVFFGYDGKLHEQKTAEAVLNKFNEYQRIVVPGFYGAYPTGEIKLFSRGGSDITGSILAMSVGAEKYENWTDVSGILVTDPKIVDSPRRIEEITYDELRELSYMGASVLHEETIFPIKELNIPIYILNTNRPEDAGTKICKDAEKNDCVITGIAGRKNYKAFTIVKSMNVSKLDVIRDTLDVFKRFNVAVEHVPTSIDSFGVIVDGKGIDNSVYDILAELKKVYGVISVDVDNDLALVAVVGRNMVLKPGISGKVFSIFGNNGINVKTIAQGVKEISIIVGVASADFENAIRAVYDGLVR